MVAVARDLVRIAPDPKHQESLARSLDQLGHGLFEQERPREAEPLHREAIAILTPLQAADPGSERMRISLASALNNLGRCVLEAGQPAAAAAHWRQAADLWRRTIDDHPDVPTYHSV